MKLLRAAVVLAAVWIPQIAAAQYAGLDVGAPALPGTTSLVSAGSAYDVTAAGSDIYATSDQFHFAYRVQSGDFDLRVRVASLTAVHEWSKAGLMARESMNPASRQVSVFATPAGGYEFQHRAASGVFVQKIDSAARVSYPNTWVRLKRVGNEFTSYTSTDGASWTQFGTTTLALPASVFLGMAATSHDVAQSVVAKFRDLGAADGAGVDVGGPALAGRTSVIAAGNAYDVAAAGSDIYGASDQFHFAYKLHGGDFDAYKLQSGDFDLRVRVASFTAAHQWSKAGLMARESMDAASRQVSVFATPAGGYEFQHRASTGALVQKIDSAAKVTYPNTWVRLRRIGNEFTSYTSADGANWAHFGSATLALPASVFLGMAVTSHDATQSAVAKFRDLSPLSASPDTAAPSVPGGLAALAVSSSQIKLSWNVSTDNVGVTGYRVLRNGVQIATTSTLAYTDAGLSASTSYSYTVAAFDAAGNVSAPSTAASATTQAPPDTTAPSIPAGVGAVAMSSTQINLAWSASTDNVAVTGYKVLRGGVQVAVTSSLTYADMGLSASTTYSYTVTAFDAAGNVSAPSTAASATTQPAPDTTAPSTPTGLSASAISASQINLVWNAATDNVGVTGYKVLRGGVQIATTSMPAYADVGLTASTIYTYAVVAFDAAGNSSAASATASASTLAVPDLTAPSTPGGLSASAVSSSQISLAWSASTDNVAVTGYNVLRNGVLVGGTSALAYTDSGLSPATTYSYTITAADAAGNLSAPSTAASATTLQSASGNATASLGINVTGITDWSQEWTFIDAFKASRPWISGSSIAWSDTRTLATDANGWVTSLQSDQVARTLLLWDLKGFYPAGTYVVLYDGEGTMRYGSGATLDLAQSTPGRHVLQVNPSKGGISIDITATTVGNHLRNIRVIMPGGICEGDPYRYAADAAACAGAGAFQSFEANYATLVFHPKFLERIRNYRLVRFMDWGATNNSTQSAWSGRPKPSDARWAAGYKGVPVEVMVELANRIGADAWFSLPHLADNNYVTEYATLVRQNLRTDLKAYVEYSNEVWNGQFGQAKYAQSQGLALGLSANAYQAQLFYYSKRSVEIFDLWSAAFNDPARLVRVMGSQAASTWVSEQVLDFENAKLKTDALAIAPYFGGYLGSPGEASRVEAMTLTQLFAELDTVALPRAISSMGAQASTAKARGLPLLAYEAGQHLSGHGGVENNATINSLFDAANRDPRMGTLYTKYLDAWKASGATLMVAFVNCSGYTKWGRWGALEYLEQPRANAPKFDALQGFIEKNPAWW